MTQKHMETIVRKHHTIDATDRPLGRLATEVATLLRGKHKASFTPHIDAGDFVIIENIDHVKITGKKLTQKLYRHHTGYPGGLRETKMQTLISEKGAGEALRRAVWNMLPKNKLRQKIITRLNFKND